MSAADRVEAFVRDQFGGASLQPPAIDVPSLRFTLGGDFHTDAWYHLFVTERDPFGRFTFDLPGPLSRRKPRVRQAVDRAATLYEEVFAPDDAGFLVASGSPEARGVGVDGLLALLPDGSAVERSSGTNYWGDDPDHDYPYVRLVAACSPRKLDYRSLFQMLAHADLGLEPTVAAWVLIVNETRPAIFNMYDDRGALVYAPSADRLAPLADAHGDWITSEVAT
jgi:hypothetical protein